MSSRPNHLTLRRPGSFLFAMSVGRSPPGNVEHGPGGERTVLGGEPAYQGGDLVDRDEAVHGNFRKHVVYVLLRHLVEDRGLRCRRSYAVHEDARLRKLFAQGLGKSDDSRL